MPLTLNAAFVPSALQIIGSTRNTVDKAEAWCTEKGCDAGEVIHAKLIDDMFDFSYQVKSVAVHTAGAIEGLRAGVFSPDLAPPPDSFAGLRAALDDAQSVLEKLGVDELEEFMGKPMRFEFRDFGIDFTAEDFLLSFSQPNFYFHATTAYDIMRMLGASVGKTDYLGKLRTKRS